MKQRTFWILVAVMVAVAVVTMIGDDANGAITQSWDGTERFVTFATDIDCDSARMRFIIPDTTAPYVTNVHTTIKLSPWVQDSTYLRGTGLVLDSTIIYLVSTLYYPQGSATARYDTSYWYHNSLNVYPAISAPVLGKTCAVAVYVRNNAGAFVSGVTVTAYLGGSNLADSSGAAVSNAPQRLRTDANGRVVFTCLWSSYIIPATKWWFSCQSPDVGTLKTSYLVPRQDTVTLQLR